MTQPATGTTWDGAHFNDLDSRFLERGKPVQVLVRDERGEDTDISPHNDDGSVRWSPFAQDGKWRDDLLAQVRINGIWQPNPIDENEGFLATGAFKDGDGPTTKPKITNDDFMILQTDFPFDSDLVEQGEPFSFTPVETLRPVVRRLRNLLRLHDDDGTCLVELPGEADAGWSRPLVSENWGRQFLLVREFRRGGLPIYTVEGYSLARSSDFGESKKDKKDSEASELSYQPLPSGYFMAMVDGEYVPILRHIWVGGSGFAAMAAEGSA